jgi:hypothetical protein
MMRRYWLLGLVLAATLMIVGCGPATPSAGSPEEPGISGSFPSAGGSAWASYRDSLLKWAEGIASSAPESTDYGGESLPSIDDSDHDAQVEGQLENLRALERFDPPPELAAMHQDLVRAFRDFYEADELYRQTQAARNYLAAMKAGIEAQQKLDRVNVVLLQLVEALKEPT